MSIRLLMMGTGPFAVPTFESLLDSEHEVVGLVTRPTTRPRGRRKTPPNPMRDVGLERQLLMLEPADVNSDEARSQLSELRPDLLVVCDYGQILSNEMLSIARLGGINLHGSLLPKYRGAAPVNWAIFNGDKTTGVTVIHMTPRLDGGPCLTKREIEIGPEETAFELERRLSQIGVDAVNEAIEMLSGWDGTSVIGQLQDRAKATNARRLNKADGLVDWTCRAEQIKNQTRAFKPWPGTYTFLERADGEPLRLILDRVSRIDSAELNGEAGSVLYSDGKSLLVATGDGVLSIDQVQPTGKKVLKIDEFLRGYSVKVGDKFCRIV